MADRTLRALRLPLLLALAACRPSAAARADAGALAAEIDRALALREQGGQVEGLKILEEVRRQSLATGEASLATRALNRHGDLLNDLRRTDEAAEDYQAAYTEAERRGDFFAMGRAAHDRAYMNESCTVKGEGAAVWYLRAVDARRKAKDQAGLRRSLNNLAIAHFYEKHDVEAKKFYGESLEVANATSDWEGAYKVEANLALLWALTAEGVFAGDGPLRPWAPPLKMDPQAEAEARSHFAKGIEAAAKIGLTERDVCGVLGNYGARCERLTPGVRPEEGLVAFFATLAQEADAESDGEQAESALLQAGTLYMRAADATRALPRGRPSEAMGFDKLARERLARALKISADACEAEEASDLCARYKALQSSKR